jgi:hypothetical protein
MKPESRETCSLPTPRPEHAFLTEGRGWNARDPGTPASTEVLQHLLTGFVYKLDELTDLIPPPGAPTFCGHVSATGQPH